ncbi:MAG TPA: hypothetical protein VK679_01340 [Gemmatimonadaceae bacterium]|nr:hypothetical protein [Gemmatimonadaceae bacterium]
MRVGTDSVGTDTSLTGVVRLRSDTAGTLTLRGASLPSRESTLAPIPPEHATLVGPMTLEASKATNVTFKLAPVV